MRFVRGTRVQSRGRWAAVVLAAFVPIPGALATDLIVATEYRYPTEFEVVPGVISAGGLIISEPYVVPRSFETREVGIHFTVVATVSSLGAASVALTSLSQGRMGGNTELMTAATAGDEAAVMKLLTRGAFLNARNKHGSTALMGASAGGFEQIVEVLLDGGAAVNSRSNDGSTALMFAARNGHLGVTRLLLDRGASANASDRKNLTPLLYAINGGHTDVARLLIEKGASVNTMDRYGTTPLMLASAKGEPDMVALLAEAGARK
jgi:ankyrin repeat protein